MKAAQKEKEITKTVGSMAVPPRRMMTSGNRENVAEVQMSAGEIERRNAHTVIYNKFQEHVEASRRADEEFCKKIANELRAHRVL